MRIFKKIILFIINPFRTFGFGKSSDKIVKEVSKRDYVLYIVAFLVTLLIVYINYFS